MLCFDISLKYYFHRVFAFSEDNKEELFVHQSSIVKKNPNKYKKSIGEGELVEFDIAVVENGFEAVNVTGLNGNHVQGSIFAADKRPRPKSKKNHKCR